MGAVAVATAVFMVASGSMPFVGGGGGGGYGVPISWSDAVSSGDPNALDDGFEHYVVTFDGAAAVAEPAMESGDGHEPTGAGEKLVRRVPLQLNAAGEISADDLVELSKQGTLLGIVSDGTTTYAEIEVTGKDAEASPKPAHKEKKKASEPEDSAKGDARAAVLKNVRGTTSVTVVMPGMYEVVTTAKASAFESLAGVVDVDKDVVLTVSAKDEGKKAKKEKKVRKAKKASKDPGYDAQWALDNKGQKIRGKVGKPGADIGAAKAWAVSKGKGQVVAVLDTGIDITHPDLADSIWHNEGEVCGNGKDDDNNGFVDDCSGYDFANDDASVFDADSDNAHGTHVAGVIAAQAGNGVGVAGIAPEVEIMPIKIGDSGTFRMSDVIRGIEYALANGATIINTAFGTPDKVSREEVSGLETAINHAQATEVLMVVAAGNAGRDIDRTPTYPASFPQDNVIAVGASTNAGDPAEFSNFGAVSVDLQAPGVDIVSTLPGEEYGGMSGTSMAAPMVAGSAALILATMPTLAPSEVKALMVSETSEPASDVNDPAALDVGQVLNEDGTTADEPVRFYFDGFSGATEEVAMDGSIRATVASDQLPTDSNVGFRSTLVTAVDGEMYGVIGAPVTLASGTAETDEDASVVLSPAAGFTPEEAGSAMPFGYTLPAGEYALVAQAFATSTDEPIGRPWAVFFTVAVEGAVVPGPVVAPSPTFGSTGSTDSTDSDSSAPSSGSGVVDVPGSSFAPDSSGTGTVGTTVPKATDGDLTSPVPFEGSTSVPATDEGSSGAGSSTGGSTGKTTVPSVDLEGVEDAPMATITVPPSFKVGAPGSSESSSEPVAVDLPPVPEPVSSGTLTISSVNPRFGSTDGGEVVVIDGKGFRETLYVRFGTRAARVLSVSPTQVTVVAPSHVAGVSDLTVAVSGGSTVTMAEAYTFVEPTAEATAESTATSGSSDGSTSTSGDSSPTTTVAGATTATTVTGGDTSSTGTGSTDGGSEPTTATTTATTPAPTAGSGSTAGSTTSFVLGETIEGPGGLKLRRIEGPSPLDLYPPSKWAALSCAQSTCQGTRL